MDISTLEKANKLKRDIEEYVGLQREINNRGNVRGDYHGITIAKQFWDEIGSEIQDVIGNKIRSLEDEFTKL